ncbi:ubiquitin-like modifier-activating enzyme 1 [Rhipicephalus sanguineus]|uniref:ubiquitin-like modifier-activating enzyme 1 n=1 Tax=Rhipicephalus sanguineus TaxID=34632 RepID=UPI0020C4E69F|nr:ubiquitin-like modifier-activating enzyme 1 [Rhipicephalus sanguineus]
MGARQDYTKAVSQHEDDPSPPAKRRRTDEGDASQEAEKQIQSGPSEQKPPDIDESFYSRQLYVLGRDAMVRMAQSDVLILGMGGLGVEIAKNVILAGVRSVTIHDEQVCTGVDLSAQYFLSENTLGENRAKACEASLGQLNQYVQVKAHTEPLTKDFVKKFTVVVLTETPLEAQLSVSAFTHENNIPLIVADTKGVAGQIFCDFGEKFRVLDPNGEPPRSVMIKSISQKQGVVATVHKARHGFEDGDYVTFSEVRGMTEINDCPPMEVKVLCPHRFSVQLPANYADCGIGGIATEVKIPKDVKFKPLKESLLNPEFVTCNSASADHDAQLHLGFQALHAFEEAHQQLPRPWDVDDAMEVVEFAKKMNALQAKPLKELDERILTLLSCVSSGSLCPMHSVIGSIAAQEVMKACSGKFTPIHQWFYFDAFECLPQEGAIPEMNDDEMGLTRYFAQVCVFGEGVQGLLLSRRYFVVGAGAIGCELLKNFAMMGVGACEGCIYLTDSDKVQRSNLNRQFLFRAEDVGRPKSVAATEAAVLMNPELCIVPYEKKVGPETESMYDDRFFENLNGVVTALDNVEGRRYLDRRCVQYCKPFLDSGTMGTKGSVQVVIPLMTESYSSSQDPPETSAPVCTTIKYFPYRTEHTLEWARDEFEGLFTTSAVNAVKYLSDSKLPRAICICYLLLVNGIHDRSSSTAPPLQVALLQELMKILVDERPMVFDDCVEFARLRFQEQYNTNIRQVLQVHPEGQLTRKGTPFWSGSRRCPHPIEFDPNNTLHMDYIVAAANLRAAMFGIAQNTDREAITRMLEDVEVPVFEPHGNDKVAVCDDRSTSRDETELVCDLLEELPAPRDLRDLTLKALEFDVDDESNFHVDFIVAASNLRAANYNIEPADRLKSKLVAGKIIPAIATTSSLVAGLACLEIYKLVQEHDRLELYKNSFVNLALPFVGFSEPVPPAWKKFRNQEFSFWNCIEIKGELTLSELLEYFRIQLDVEVMRVLEGTRTLYDADAPPSRTIMKLAVSKVLERMSMAKIDRQIRTLALRITGKDINSGEKVELPEVRYRLRK